MRFSISAWLVILLSLFNVNCVAAEPALDIVTDPWPPYAYEENGKVVGTDVEITLAVLERLGVKASIRLLPWKRCLGLIKTQQADAILAASITAEREAFMYFPAEPVSTGVTVFFKDALAPDPEIDLDNKKGLKLGAMLGYKYCQSLDNSRLVKAASRVATMEQNMNMLLLGRVDLVVASESVGSFKAMEMNISDKVSIVAGHRYCEGGNYLAFAKKEGFDALAVRFADALHEFKGSQAYRSILKKYGKL